MSSEIQQTLYIKNMVCTRCIIVLRQALESIGVRIRDIKLGLVSISHDPERITLKEIKQTINANDFDLAETREAQLVGKIRVAALKLIELSMQRVPTEKNSDFIAREVGYNYSHLSRLFSQHEQISIERFLILLRIEKVKELLEYQELTLSEIAAKLNYSSVQYLSSQFKNVTGISVREYRQGMKDRRKPLDQLI